MSKLTRFGYILEKKNVNTDEIRNDLTVYPSVPKSYAMMKKPTPIICYREDANYIAVPRFYGINKFGKPDKNNFDKQYPAQDMTYNGTLRPQQEIIVEKVIQGLEKHGGGLLIAGCGIGKTNMAIYIACHCKVKTLILVHKNFLKSQAANRIIDNTNIKFVGTIQGDNIETDAPITIGMIQSVCKNDKYNDKLFAQFGMVIIDEAHHMSARNFNKVFDKIGGRYMLGITAEHTRPDQTFKIVHWNLGPTLFKAEQKPNPLVLVKRISFDTKNVKRTKPVYNKWTRELDKATMISNLLHIKGRNNLTVDILEWCSLNDKKILFLSGRIKHLTCLGKKLLKRDIDFGYYVGGMSEELLKESENKIIILGTYEMAQEGLDVPGIKVVILGTPKSSVKQAVGRILRKEEYDYRPTVIEFNDIGFESATDRREAHYDKLEYLIQDYYFSDKSEPEISVERMMIDEEIQKKNVSTSIDFSAIMDE